MISAIDTNILLDVFLADSAHGPTSKKLLFTQLKKGHLVISPVVYCELVGSFVNQEGLEEILAMYNIGFVPMNNNSAFIAGATFKHYRKRGGNKVRILADFMVAAHAWCHADVLLTRDRGFHRTYFPKLNILNS